MRPQAVIFDLGKVLLDFDWSIAARKMSARSAMPAGDLLKVFDYSPLVVEFELGLISSEHFFKEASRAADFRGDFEEFSEVFSDIFTEIEAMTRMHSELRRRGIPTFIFSNTNDLAIRHVRSRFPFFSDFDGYVLSYEHRTMKPDAKLYDVVERISGRRGTELLYIDDRQENIEAGRTRGWQVILQEQPEKTIAAVRQTGLLD